MSFAIATWICIHKIEIVLHSKTTTRLSSHLQTVQYILKREYSIVKPQQIQPKRTVPDHIVKPSYATAGWLPKIFTDDKYKLNTSSDIKSSTDIEKMRNSCRIARLVLNEVGKSITAGITTDELDQIAHNLCIANDSYPSPLFYKGFPKSICTSVNNVACHGIPDNRQLQDGDIINVDVTVFCNGFHGDVSETFLVGDVDQAGRHLVNVARLCRDEAISVCKPGQRFSIIGETISSIADERNCQVIPEFCGHGIGTYFHGPPDIIHVDNDVEGFMEEGMTFTIEPVLCEGNPDIAILKDGWTVITKDDSRSAQFEHTILITSNGAEILTQ